MTYAVTNIASGQVILSASWQFTSSETRGGISKFSKSHPLPQNLFSFTGDGKNEIGGLKWWPKPACLQIHPGFSPTVAGGQVAAAYDPVFFTVYCAHPWLSVYNVIQTELPGIKVLFLLLLRNAKIPIDFAEIKSGLKWPTIDICKNLPQRKTPLIQYAAPYGWPPFRFLQQLPEAVMLAVVKTIKTTPTETVFIIGKIRPVSQATHLAYYCWLQYLYADWHWPAHGLLLHRCDIVTHAKCWAVYTCTAELPYSAWIQLWKHRSMQTLIHLTHSLTAIWG